MSDEQKDMRYPLHWPASQPRTKNPQVSRFATNRWGKTTMAQARSMLMEELRKLGARSVVLSTNIELRLDGLPRAGRRDPDDTGVAVYFKLDGHPRVLACDAWNTIACNMWAIGKHIDAMRGQERWGVGTRDQAFAGYTALPAKASIPAWWDILEIPADTSDVQVAIKAYKRLGKDRHPDHGGSDEQWAELQAAYELARAAISGNGEA